MKETSRKNKRDWFKKIWEESMEKYQIDRNKNVVRNRVSWKIKYTAKGYM